VDVTVSGFGPQLTDLHAATTSRFDIQDRD
jgi:hypothetical protein